MSVKGKRDWHAWQPSPAQCDAHGTDFMCNRNPDVQPQISYLKDKKHSSFRGPETEVCLDTRSRLLCREGTWLPDSCQHQCKSILGKEAPAFVAVVHNGGRESGFMRQHGCS